MRISLFSSPGMSNTEIDNDYDKDYDDD